MADILIKHQLRPCLVYESRGITEPKKAFFHTWVEQEEILISIEGNLPYTHREIIDEMLKREERVLPPNTKVNTQKRLYALVEYEDGKCELTSSERIRFLNSGALFYEQCWPDDEDIPLF